MGAYVYYSYEEFGRGYIGARSRSPVGDEYLGSYRDQSFNPTHKIVLAEFETFEEALEAKVELHRFYDVGRNPHFANKVRQTSSGFSTFGCEWTSEERDRRMETFTSPEFRDKMVLVTSGSNNGFFGKRHSDTTKQKISKKNTGKKHRPRTIDQRSRSSSARKKMLENRSEKEATRIAKLGHENRKPLDRMWITNGTDNQYVSKSVDIPEGWRRGRTRSW